MPDLVPFSDVQQKLREKIQGALLEFIPEEAWNTLIKEQFTAFFNGSIKRTAYGPDERIEPELHTLIKKEMRSVLEARVKAWAESWKESPTVVEEADRILRTVANEAAATFLRSVGEGLVKTALAALCEIKCASCSKPTPPKGSCHHCGHYN